MSRLYIVTLLICLYAEYIMWNARLKEAQAGIKISRKKSIISDMQMTLPKLQKQRGTKEPLDEGEEKSKKAGLKLNIQKTKIMASSPITSWQISSFQFSCSVVSDSLQPHELQQARLPCPSPTPRACSTLVHQVSDAIQPTHLLSSPSLPAFNLSQHQGLFKWVSSLHQVAKVLEFQL